MGKGLIEFHEKSKGYDWDFTVGNKSPKYQTKYTIPAKGRDPFRMLVRENSGQLGRSLNASRPARADAKLARRTRSVS